MTRVRIKGTIRDSGRRAAVTVEWTDGTLTGDPATCDLFTALAKVYGPEDVAPPGGVLPKGPILATAWGFRGLAAWLFDADMRVTGDLEPQEAPPGAII